MKLREMSYTNEVLSLQFEKLENRVTQHDTILIDLVKEIRNLTELPKSKISNHIGFCVPDKKDSIDG